MGSEHLATIRTIQKLALLTHARVFADPVQTHIHDPTDETLKTKVSGSLCLEETHQHPNYIFAIYIQSAALSPTDEVDALFERVANAVSRCHNFPAMELQVLGHASKR